MAIKISYEEELRVIGQTLESKGISICEITCLPERYVIHAVANQSGSASKKLLGFLRSSGNSETYSFTLSSAEIKRQGGIGKAVYFRVARQFSPSLECAGYGGCVP